MKSANSSFTILFATSLLSQLKTCLTLSQLSSLLIKINEINSDNIIDSPVELIGLASERCGFSPLVNLNIHQAKEKAVQWLENDIFVLFEDNQQILFAQGNREILNSATVAILNSRKARAVTSSTRWLKVTINLTKQAIAKRFTVVSSLGMLTYELVTFMANKHSASVIIVLDGYLPGTLLSDSQKFFYDKFNSMFELKNTLFISSFWPEVTLPSWRERLAKRDYWVVNLAKYLYVAECRAEGNIYELASKSLGEGKKVAVFCLRKFDKDTKGNQKLLLAGGEEVICDLDAQSCKGETPQQVKICYPTISGNPNLIEGKLPQQIEDSNTPIDEYLFHYTRACPGPWPGQSLATSIQSLIDAHSTAGHTAFDTLCRILKEQLIRASNRLVRGETPVVSFTACLLDELIKIRKWNSALIRWTFEPYGLGIRKNILKKMGVQPVIYAPEEEFRKLPEEDKFRFQLYQPPKTDWSVEKEWRVPKNVSLTHLSAEDIVIVVATPQEAMIINKDFSLPVILAKKCGT